MQGNRMADGRDYGVFHTETGKCKLANVSKAEAETYAKELNATATGRGEWYADVMSDDDLRENSVPSLWKRKLTEGTATSVYWMVDWLKAPNKQITLPYDQVQFAYRTFLRDGNLNAISAGASWKDALERLFKHANKDRLRAFLTNELWTPAPSKLSPPDRTPSPTPVNSVTGGEVDLSGFPLLDTNRQVHEDASNVAGATYYRVTNKRTERTIQVRAMNADQAVELAMAKGGPNTFGFPLLIQNLETNKAVHIMNDAEYDSKIRAVDQKSQLSIQSSDTHSSKIRHPSEDNKALWRQRFESAEIETDGREMLTETNGLFYFVELSGHGKFERVSLPWANCEELANALSWDGPDPAKGPDLGPLTDVFAKYYTARGRGLELWNYDVLDSSSGHVKVKMTFSVHDPRSDREEREATWNIVQDYPAD